MLTEQWISLILTSTGQGSANVTSAPKTGDTSSALIPAFALTMAGAASFASRKSKNK